MPIEGRIPDNLALFIRAYQTFTRLVSILEKEESQYNPHVENFRV